MNLEQLRVFTAVADRLHMTQAAKQLNMTQSAASGAIASLEARYGVQLFHRIGRGLTLSEAGRAFLGEAKELLAHAGEVEASLIEVSDLRRGTLSLSASLTIASYRLPHIMLDFHRRHPGITLSLRLANTSQVAESVIAGEVDIGFIEGEVDDSSFERHVIGEDNLALLVAPGHPLATKKAITRADIIETAWILREPGSGTRQTFAEGMERYGVRLAELEIALELPSNEAVRTAVESGVGATALSQLVASGAIGTGALVQIPFAFAPREFLAIRRADRHFSRAEQAFLELAGT